MSLFDGNWFDIASVGGGFVYAGVNRLRLNDRPALISKKTGLDVFNGASLLPLFFLVSSLFSTEALNELSHANRVILSLAGLVALFAILETP